MEWSGLFEVATDSAQDEAQPREVTGEFVREKLAQAGLRPTLQRLDLGRLIFGRGNWHFTAEALFAETRSLRYPPSLATIYNTLAQFAKCGLLREVAAYDAKLWYCTKTGPHYHFYLEDTEQLFDIPRHLEPVVDVPAPPGMRVKAIDIIVRLTRE